MADLIDRVAKAMCEGNALEKQDWSKLPEYKRDWWRNDARIAVPIILDEAAKMAETWGFKFYTLDADGNEVVFGNVGEPQPELAKAIRMLP